MKLVFFSVFTGSGINAMCRCLRENGHEVALLVTTRGRPETMNATREQLFQERLAQLDHDLPTLVINRLRVLPPILRALEADAFFVMNFPFRLNDTILSIPPLGAVNFHPSRLPKYRGPNPLGWQILNGEPTLGLSFHRMDTAYDCGPILLQGESPILATDTFFTLYERLPELLNPMLPDVMRLIEARHPGSPQADDQATNAPFFGEAERTLDWTQPAVTLHRLIRASFEGVIASVDGARYLVQESALAPAVSAAIAPTRVGQAVSLSDGSLIVRTGDGFLKLVRYVRPEPAPV